MTETAQQILELIDKHRRSPLVAMSPLSALLPLLRGWITDTENRLRKLESAQAKK